MSTLDPEFHALSHAIYEALGMPESDHIIHNALCERIDNDVREYFGEYRLHEPQALATTDLSMIESELRDADTSQDGVLDSPEQEAYFKRIDVDFLPTISHDEVGALFPLAASKYSQHNLNQRGERNPLYDALESYLEKRNNSSLPFPKERIAARIQYVLIEMRESAYLAFEDLFKGEEGYNQPLTAKAHKYADAYMMKALNQENISRAGNTETLRDLIKRYMDEKGLKQIIQPEAGRNLSNQFLENMVSASRQRQ